MSESALSVVLILLVLLHQGALIADSLFRTIMCALAAYNAKASVNRCLAFVHGYRTHGTVLHAVGTADAGVFAYLHGESTGNKASQDVKQGIICTNRA